MGWTAYHREPGDSNHAHFQRELFANTDHEIVTCATIRLEAFYAAVRTKSTGEVWALIVLIRHMPGHHNFAYKFLDESVDLGVSWADAPASVLDALTPTDNETALQWRQRCRVNLAKHKQIRDRERAVRSGVVIEFDRALRFQENRSAARLQCIHRSGNDILWGALDENGSPFTCRLPARWAYRWLWTIISPAPAATPLPGIGAPSGDA